MKAVAVPKIALDLSLECDFADTGVYIFPFLFFKYDEWRLERKRNEKQLEQR